uniref:hypothetical protein n=1 Tax=Alloprevotella sp. TaxID=1872471 RepID=UPI003FEF67C2
MCAIDTNGLRLLPGSPLRLGVRSTLQRMGSFDSWSLCSNPEAHDAAVEQKFGVPPHRINA